MVQTRNTASQVDPVDLNTPPPPTTVADQGLGQFMAAQTQLMNAMMQNMNQMLNQRNQTAATLVAMLPQPPPTFP